MVYDIGEHTYELVDGWAKLDEGESFVDVGGIAIDSQDRVHILNRGKHHVMVLDREGNVLTSWGEGLFGRAHGACIGPDGSVYCTDDVNHTVRRFSPEGKLLLTLGKEGQASDTGFVHTPGMSKTACLHTIARGGPPFNLPTGVSISASGEIYVSDGYGNARVHKFSQDGTLLLSWGGPGTGPGQFRLPHSICVDKHDRAWVVDRQNDRVQIFNTQGEFLDQWTDLSLPTDIFIDKEETVYISELKQRVSMFDINGKLLGRWSSQGQDKDTTVFHAPHAIAVDSRGDVYVGEVSKSWANVDKGARTIQKLARQS
jgi:DNA-binding beta-propeller fold protein YncE